MAYSRKRAVPGDPIPRMPELPKLPAFPKGQRFPGFPSVELTPVALPSEFRRGAPTDQSSTHAPVQPLWWTGSDLEWLVYWWLTAHGVEFEYLAQFMGGRRAAFQKGQEFDFVVSSSVVGGKGLVIDVHGDYFHYRSTSGYAKEKLRKQFIQAHGYTVVFVRGNDLVVSLDGTMRAALQGVQTYPD